MSSCIGIETRRLTCRSLAGFSESDTFNRSRVTVASCICSLVDLITASLRHYQFKFAGESKNGAKIRSLFRRPLFEWKNHFRIKRKDTRLFIRTTKRIRCFMLSERRDADLRRSGDSRSRRASASRRKITWTPPIRKNCRHAYDGFQILNYALHLQRNRVDVKAAAAISAIDSRGKCKRDDNKCVSSRDSLMSFRLTGERLLCRNFQRIENFSSDCFVRRKEIYIIAMISFLCRFHRFIFGRFVRSHCRLLSPLLLSFIGCMRCDFSSIFSWKKTHKTWSARRFYLLARSPLPLLLRRCLGECTASTITAETRRRRMVLVIASRAQARSAWRRS